MSFSYKEGSLNEALYWIRTRVGDTSKDRNQLEDEEISALLVDHGLTDTSSSVTSRSALYNAAADAARTIAARFAKDSEIAITEVGRIKSDASASYLRLAAKFEDEAKAIQPDQLEPVEEMDSLDYDRDRLGRDRSEYVGDIV